MKRLGTIVVVLAVGTSLRPSADADRAKLAAAYPAVDKLFEDFVAQSHVPGAAWGIVVDGELAHSGVTGLRDVNAKAPVDEDTVFRIASMTKSFTAMSILKLRDEGRLSLDDPAERYVPELEALKYPTSDSPRITVRHLLSHAEGFPEDNPWGDRQLARTDEELSQMIRGGIPFSNAPGVAYEYSNYGFAILGRIVASVSGVPYREYVTANVLRPLGMSSTTLEPRSVAPQRLALGYRWVGDAVAREPSGAKGPPRATELGGVQGSPPFWKEEPQLPDGAFGSMGGMLTSLRDLSRYVGVFLSAWPPRDGPETAPIRRSSLREMQQVWRPAPASVTRDNAGAIQLNTGGYAYGLRVSQTCSFRHIVAHSGGLPGFGSIMQWLPEHGVGIIAFGNLTYTSWGRVAAGALELLNKTGGMAPRMPKPSAALVSARDAVSRLIVKWDDRAAGAMAAENLFLDQSKDRRRAEIEALTSKVGACKPPDSFEFVENALRGRWTMNCERGKLQVSITLAPTIPPRVQFLRVIPAPADPPRAETCP